MIQKFSCRELQKVLFSLRSKFFFIVSLRVKNHNFFLIFSHGPISEWTVVYVQILSTKSDFKTSIYKNVAAKF